MKKKEIYSCLVKGVLASYVHTYFISSHRCLQYNLLEHFYWHIFTASTLQYLEGRTIFPNDLWLIDGVLQRCLHDNNLNMSSTDRVQQFWLLLAIRALSTETGLVLCRGIRGHRSLTLHSLRPLGISDASEVMLLLQWPWWSPPHPTILIPNKNLHVDGTE